jgi:hypothetical protein
MATDIPNSSEYPLYGTTFTVHRLSPLFCGRIVLDNPTLAEYASAFRDLLAGEVLRGVRVGLASDDDILARIGGLQSVRWTILEKEEDWQNQTQLKGDDERSRRGILVDITYERASYAAIIVHDADAQEVSGFLNYPLLLTRMPGPLRETFLDFITTTFDTRVSVMKLSSQFLVSSLEGYLDNITTGEDGPLNTDAANIALRSIVKSLLVTLAFDVPGITLSLKNVDVTISQEDTYGMITRGRKLVGNGNTGGPFTAALRHYLDAHLALDINNDHVSISKIACAAFVLGTEGKIKLLGSLDEGSLQFKATSVLVQRLIENASNRTIDGIVRQST